MCSNRVGCVIRRGYAGVAEVSHAIQEPGAAPKVCTAARGRENLQSDIRRMESRDREQDFTGAGRHEGKTIQTSEVATPNTSREEVVYVLHAGTWPMISPRPSTCPCRSDGASLDRIRSLMSPHRTDQPATQRDPDEWTTDDAPMIDAHARTWKQRGARLVKNSTVGAAVGSRPLTACVSVC
jgi:hypothetical protein